MRYLRRELRAKLQQQQLSLLDDDDTDAETIQTTILRARAVIDLADAGRRIQRVSTPTARAGSKAAGPAGAGRWKVPVSPS